MLSGQLLYYQGLGDVSGAGLGAKRVTRRGGEHARGDCPQLCCASPACCRQEGGEEGEAEAPLRAPARSPLKAASGDSSAVRLCAPRSPAAQLRPRPVGSAGALGGRTHSMRLPSMSGHFLLSPIPESSSDYLLPRDIKLAVLGASCVGKSGECFGDRTGRRPPWAGPDNMGLGKSGSSRWGRRTAQGGPGHPLPPGFAAACRSTHSWAVAGFGTS